MRTDRSTGLVLILVGAMLTGIQGISLLLNTMPEPAPPGDPNALFGYINPFHEYHAQLLVLYPVFGLLNCALGYTLHRGDRRAARYGVWVNAVGILAALPDFPITCFVIGLCGVGAMTCRSEVVATP